MQVQHQQDKENGVFYIEDADVRIAEMEYILQENHHIMITHTEVSEAYRGKDVGKTLVEFSVEFARTNKLKIVPACRYAKAVISASKEMQDVL